MCNSKSHKLPHFYSTIFTIALPIVLQNLLQTFVNMLDTIMVGRIGSTEIASVGLGNQVFFILNMVLFGISSGGAIFVSQFWGKKDISGIRHTLGITLSFSFVLSIIFTVAAFFFPEDLMRIYSDDAQVIKLGGTYLRFVSLSYPLFAVSFAYQLALRATEHVRLPTISTAVSFCVNIIANYILIFGLSFDGVLIIKPMGVAGAAIATVFSRLVELIIITSWSYYKKYEACGKLNELLSFSKSFLFRFLKIAFPVILNETIWSLGISVENSIFSRASTEAIAAYNITSTISRLTWVFFIGVGNGAGIIIGKKIGEGENDIAIKYANKCAYFMPLMAVFIGLLLIPLSLLLPYFFNVEYTIILQGQKMLRVLMFAYPLCAFNMCFIVGICRAGGDTIYAAVNDIIWLWVIAIPLAKLVATLFKTEPYIIYLCMQVEQVFKAIAGIVRLRSGKWLNNVTR